MLETTARGECVLICVMIWGRYTLSGKGGSQGCSRKGVYEKGGSQGVHKKGVHVNPMNPPWIRAWEAVTECTEREKRKCNLTFHNVMESEKTDSQTRRKEDNDEVVGTYWKTTRMWAWREGGDTLGETSGRKNKIGENCGERIQG